MLYPGGHDTRDLLVPYTLFQRGIPAHLPLFFLPSVPSVGRVYHASGLKTSPHGLGANIQLATNDFRVHLDKYQLAKTDGSLNFVEAPGLVPLVLIRWGESGGRG